MEKTSSLKKGTPKDSQGFGPYQNKPFRGPHHNKKRGSYRKHPYGGNSSQSSNQSFSSCRGKSNNTYFRGCFRPHSRGRWNGNPSLNDSLKASLSPLVGGCLRSFRRDWLTNKISNNMVNIISNGYLLSFISRPSLTRVLLIHSGYKALQKDQALASCIQSLLSKPPFAVAVGCCRSSLLSILCCKGGGRDSLWRSSRQGLKMQGLGVWRR